MPLLRCQNCDTLVHHFGACARCGAPLPRRILPTVMMLCGFGIAIAVFAVCLHFLEASVAEYQPPVPTNPTWSDSDEENAHHAAMDEMQAQLDRPPVMATDEAAGRAN